MSPKIEGVRKDEHLGQCHHETCVKRATYKLQINPMLMLLTCRKHVAFLHQTVFLLKPKNQEALYRKVVGDGP